MSYYFTIIGTKDNPLFEHTFGTSKPGGDGTAKFRDEATHMNQFIVHAALDMVEEIQWTTKDLYLKKVDTFQNNHIHAFITGGNVKFMLLMNPDPQSTPYSNFSSPPPSRSGATSSARQSALLANNPSSSQTEDAVRGFMTEVYEAWVKCLMNPFYEVNQEVTSPVFRGRVQAAAKRYLMQGEPEPDDESTTEQRASGWKSALGWIGGSQQSEKREQGPEGDSAAQQ